MDMLQTWGLYAPLLVYLLVASVSGVAAWRTGTPRAPGQRATLLTIVRSLLERVVGAMVLFMFFTLDFGDTPPTLWWIAYGSYLCSPLLLIASADILRAPPAAADAAAHAAPTWYPSRLLAVGGVIVLTVITGSISVMSVGLQPCGWLDRSLQRSGCVRSLASDDQSLESVAFSPDSTLIAAGGSAHTIRLYRVADGQLERTLLGHTDWISSVAFSPDHALLASGSWDGTVRLWRLDDGALLRVLTAPSQPTRAVDTVAFSPDGTLLAAAFDGRIVLWRVADATVSQIIPSAGTAIAFSPDGALLALEQPAHQITLWNLATGAALRTLAGHRYGITSLAFAPDGQTLGSSCGSEKILKLWRVRDGSLLQTLPGPARSSLAFSPDSTRIASGVMTNDIDHLRGLLTIWRVADGTVDATWEAHRTLISSVAFSPDAQLLLTASSTGTIRLWQARTFPE